MEKSILDLAQNEYIVYEKEDSVVLYKDEELTLFITNLNMILLSETTRLFKKSTYDVVKWPIADIKIIDNVPQIKIEYDDDNGCWNIVILFVKGIQKIGFYSDKSLFKRDNVKKDVEQLAENISQLRMKGTIVLKKTAHDNSDSIKYEAETIKDKIKYNPLSQSIAKGIASIANSVKPKEKKNIEQASDVSKVDVESHIKPTQPEADGQYNFCQFCGAKKDKNAKFCPSCGKPQLQ